MQNAQYAWKRIEKVCEEKWENKGDESWKDKQISKKTFSIHKKKKNGQSGHRQMERKREG